MADATQLKIYISYMFPGYITNYMMQNYSLLLFPTAYCILRSFMNKKMYVWILFWPSWQLFKLLLEVRHKDFLFHNFGYGYFPISWFREHNIQQIFCKFIIRLKWNEIKKKYQEQWELSSKQNIKNNNNNSLFNFILFFAIFIYVITICVSSIHVRNKLPSAGFNNVVSRSEMLKFI